MTQPMEYTLNLPDTIIARFADLGYDNPLDGLNTAAKLLLGIGPEAWATITAGSAAAEISPAKYVLQQLSKADQPANASPAPAATPKERHQNNELRDKEIWRDAKAGVRHADIAAHHKLSLIRVSQIVAVQRAKEKAENTAEGVDK